MDINSIRKMGFLEKLFSFFGVVYSKTVMEEVIDKCKAANNAELEVLTDLSKVEDLFGVTVEELLSLESNKLSEVNNALLRALNKEVSEPTAAIYSNYIDNLISKNESIMKEFSKINSGEVVTETGITKISSGLQELHNTILDLQTKLATTDDGSENTDIKDSDGL